MKRESWDQRYAASDLVWGAGPNRFVEAAFGDAAPRGRALDLACGEGRNAIWLAERGWDVTGVDWSHVAVERARKLAAERGADVRFVAHDVTAWAPEAGAYALVLVSYLQVPVSDRLEVWRHAALALAPGGELFGIAHAVRNLAEGFGGPQDAGVLWEPETVAAELRSLGLEVDVAEHVTRPVEGEERPAIDTRIRAHR